MIGNFLIALVGSHLAIGDSIEDMTPTPAMLFGVLTLFFTGAGNLSIDYIRLSKNQNT